MWKKPASLIFFLVIGSIVLSATELERRAEVEKWDKMKLRHATGVVTDSSKDLLKVHKDYPGDGDFIIAKKAPVVDFVPIRGQVPYFFPEDNKGLWSQWSEVTKGPNGCYYMASGDHRCKNGKIFITEYDPVKKDQRIVVDVGKVCGWKEGMWVDGKIHGRMDIFPDGTLVAATWLGRKVRQEDIDHGYINGGHLLTYNVLTGSTKYHGIPFLGDSWPYYSVDTQTGVMMAIGADQHFMAYNVLTDRLLYGGSLPQGMIWNSRSMLLDDRTGRVYSTDTSKDHNFTPNDEEYYFICYDQLDNTFRKLECKVPANPGTNLCSSLRAYSVRRTPENFFWCFDYQGTIFKFFPDEERIELVGVNWEKDGVYTASMAVSPNYRYLYYVLGSHSASHIWDTPVVQYDTITEKKKVIAFLNHFYHDKYGYLIGGTFGIELSEDGSLLVIQTNGKFGPRPAEKRSALDQVAIFTVHIPESERIE